MKNDPEPKPKHLSLVTPDTVAVAVKLAHLEKSAQIARDEGDNLLAWQINRLKSKVIKRASALLEDD